MQSWEQINTDIIWMVKSSIQKEHKAIPSVYTPNNKELYGTETETTEKRNTKIYKL